MKLTKEILVGTWKSVKYTLTDENGVDFYPFGEDCRGYLIYTADGHVAAEMSTNKGRIPYASKDLHEGTKEEMAEAAHTYMAYTGTYTVDFENGRVFHNIELSMNPTWEDQSQARYINYDGKYLSITADVNTAKLVWEKVK